MQQEINRLPVSHEALEVVSAQVLVVNIEPLLRYLAFCEKFPGGEVPRAQ
ncbi:MAG: hypothetical protein WDO74_23715 [Pseudomonadota bacterium]